ncbi:hypothetical protein D3C81_1632180 [compost metagenome]
MGNNYENLKQVREVLVSSKMGITNMYVEEKNLEDNEIKLFIELDKTEYPGHSISVFISDSILHNTSYYDVKLEFLYKQDENKIKEIKEKYLRIGINSNGYN